jgi:prepilin-type N-terminal cleavage/methylation domain-containing protein
MHQFPLRRAFTLLELMLSLVIISILMASLVFFSKAFMTTATSFSKNIYADLSIRSFIDKFSHDMSQAGFTPVGSILVPTLTAETGNSAIFIANNSDGNVSIIRISYDSYNYAMLNNLNRRNYITYSMQPMDGRASFANGIYVDRAYRTSTSGTATAPLKDFSSKQLALSLVKKFTCVEKKISGLTKGLNCQLEVYSDLNVNSQLLTYDFEANSEQIY